MFCDAKYFHSPPRKCRKCSRPTLKHVKNIVPRPRPTEQLCHTIDTHIWGIITQKVSPLQIICAPSKFSKIFHGPSISTCPPNCNYIWHHNSRHIKSSLTPIKSRSRSQMSRISPPKLPIQSIIIPYQRVGLQCVIQEEEDNLQRGAKYNWVTPVLFCYAPVSVKPQIGDMQPRGFWQLSDIPPRGIWQWCSDPGAVLVFKIKRFRPPGEGKRGILIQKVQMMVGTLTEIIKCQNPWVCLWSGGLVIHTDLCIRRLY